MNKIDYSTKKNYQGIIAAILTSILMGLVLYLAVSVLDESLMDVPTISAIKSK